MGYKVYNVLVYHDKNLFYEFHPNLHCNDKRGVLQGQRDWKLNFLKGIYLRNTLTKLFYHLLYL